MCESAVVKIYKTNATKIDVSDVVLFALRIRWTLLTEHR